MPDTTDVLVEKDFAAAPRFTAADYKRGLEALERLRQLSEGLPPVDVVAIIREMRDTGERGADDDCA